MKKLFLAGISILIGITMVLSQTKQADLTVLKGSYLGQKPPGMIPELFPPRMLQADSTWFWHGSPIFSPDLKEMYFVKYIKGQPRQYCEMYWMKCEDNRWTSPRSTSFSNPSFRNNNPFFIQTKDTLYFYRARAGGKISFVTRKGEDWSEPSILTLPVPSGKNLGRQFSITRNGTIYSELWESDDSDGDIYRWRIADSNYSASEKLSISINSPNYDFNPFIDPDERFLLFCSNRPGGFGKNDIYISFRNMDGSWTKAINIGSKINSGDDEAFPSITPDGKYFFFCREGKYGFNPYWVDVKVLEDPILKRAK